VYRTERFKNGDPDEVTPLKRNVNEELFGWGS